MRLGAMLFITTGIVCLGTATAPIRAQPLAFDAASVKVQDPDGPKIFQMSDAARPAAIRGGSARS